MSEIRGSLTAGVRRFAIVASRYNELVTARLIEGAQACLREHGAADGHVDVIVVPGAWELPAAAQRAVTTGRYAAVIALGCVIRGETPHFEYVAGEAARGLGALSRSCRVPVAFGVLTTDTREQALARAGGQRGNKGWEAALSALEMADLFHRLETAGESS